MAEYINREELFHQGEWMYDTKAECEADALRYVVKMNTINLMTPVDVVEREKIDEALDETYKIRNEILQANGCYEPNDVIDIIDQITKLFEEI